MDNTSVSPETDHETTTEDSASTSKHLLVGSHELVLSRIWLATNLAAVAAIGTVYPAAGSAQTFIAWAAFTLLNACLHLASRKGLWVGNAAADSPSFNAGIAVVFGLSWGAGTTFMLPALAGSEVALLLATVLAVALFALPVFSNDRSALTYFVATLTVLVVAGLVRDGRFTQAIVWVVLAAASLQLLGSSFAQRQKQLREIINLLVADNQATGTRYADHELPTIAERRAEFIRELELSTARNRRVLRALGDAVIATDAEGTVEYVNPVAEVLLGFTAKDLRGRQIDQGLKLVFPPDRRNQASEIFRQARLTRRAQQGDDNVQLIRRDGVVYGIDYVVTAMKDEFGDFAGASFVLRDVTARRHKADDIAWKATHDPLTGTINRSEFEIRLKKLVERAQDNNTNIHAMLYLDIDKFKFVNDTYGHAAGDAVLKSLAQVLRSRIRGADTLARIGGDEFATLLYSCTAEKARMIAENLRIAVERHEFIWQSIDLPVSVSIGIVEINQECKSVAEIVRAADSACYSAKKFGRNRVHQFEKGAADTSKKARVFDFVKDIQTAIQGNRLELFYHPMHATSDDQNEISHCELSVGVRNTEGEIVPRADLAELCRRYHLTEDIDRWVVKAALDALRLNHPALSEMEMVIVPLSQRSFNDDRLLGYIKEQVKDNKAQAHRIGFAFDDGDSGAQLEHVRYFMSALKDFGCQFMINDLAFGSHTLEVAKSLNADFFGIRRQLIENMLYNSVDYEIVLGLTRVAHALGMKTIAERADTQLLRDALGKMGIDYTKGHQVGESRRVCIQTDAQWI